MRPLLELNHLIQNDNLDNLGPLMQLTRFVHNGGWGRSRGLLYINTLHRINTGSLRHVKNTTETLQPVIIIGNYFFTVAQATSVNGHGLPGRSSVPTKCYHSFHLITFGDCLAGIDYQCARK